MHFRKLLNLYSNKPFVALLSYDEPENDIICTPDEAYKFGIKFRLNKRNKYVNKYKLKKFPIDLDEYQKAFENVQKRQLFGDSYLLNLCFKTPIKTNFSLDEIYENAGAKLAILKQNDFVCFSPESFVTIYKDTIHTFPMKGTISSKIPNAKKMLLDDKKELSEQAMIVDLMRNDLSMVANNVSVVKFRYFQKVKNLYQTSSYIKGRIRDEFKSENGLKFGDIFSKILPAGSITGTPKHTTCKIIRESEHEKRGFYTGVFIYFNGRICKSFVLIRFIKQESSGLSFFSGGGITLDSDLKGEYDELIKKVYLPF